MRIPAFRPTRRQREAADRFHDNLDAHTDAGGWSARALRPPTALNEVRRTQMRDAMFEAFDRSRAVEEARPVAVVDAAGVSTAEVLTGDGMIRLADVETIGEERAQAIAAAVLRQVSAEAKGGVRGFRSNLRP